MYAAGPVLLTPGCHSPLLLSKGMLLNGTCGDAARFRRWYYVVWLYVAPATHVSVVLDDQRNRNAEPEDCWWKRTEDHHFPDEDRIDLPWKPEEDDTRCLGAGLRELDHSFLHAQQWLPGWPPVRRRTSFLRNALPSRTWHIVPGVLLRQRHVSGDLQLRLCTVPAAWIPLP